MYFSTRGNKKMDASLALLKGIADDGGLYITNLPSADINKLVGLSYKEIALYVLKLLLDDFKEEDLVWAIDKAYSHGFDCQNLVEVKSFDKFSFLELYHGPTLAFKDMALTILPKLLHVAKKMNNHTEKTIILTATSGDTGAAALNGFKDMENTEIVVFYPHNGVSDVQMRQMLSYQGTNATVIAVKGNFDDCQTFVKNVFNDNEIKEKLGKVNKALSSANSINIGRLIPQVVYYFYSYMNLVEKGEIKLGDKINFCVPTGNFGNILAGYYAKKMGLPINKLICASNKNNVLTDFFNTGVYSTKRDFYKTNSPSMDILISSNLERLLFEFSNCDGKMVSDLMSSLKENKEYKIDVNNSTFKAYYASEEETLENIKEVYDSLGYLMDTHTAVAYKAYKDYVNETNDDTKTVIVSTACPYKFAGSVSQALNRKEDNEFNQINDLHKLSSINIHPSLEKIKNLEPKEIVLERYELKDKLFEMWGIKNV